MEAKRTELSARGGRLPVTHQEQGAKNQERGLTLQSGPLAVGG